VLISLDRVSQFIVATTTTTNESATQYKIENTQVNKGIREIFEYIFGKICERRQKLRRNK
jgi:hypothetical protein